MDELIAYFEKCGVSTVRAQETAKNAKFAATVSALFKANELEQKGLDGKQALLALQVAKDGAKIAEDEKKTYVLDRIAKKDLKSPEQVTAAIKFVSSNAWPVDDAAFDKACGVGFAATPEQILASVQAYVSEKMPSVEPAAAWAAIGRTLGALKTEESVKWAPALDVKAAVEQVFETTWGPKSAAKAAPAAKTKDSTKGKKPEVAAPEEVGSTDMFGQGWLARLHKPGENPQTKPELKEQHLKFTHGKVFTRFPPEPNGFLHIGHSKAIAVNFGYAKYHGGNCYLRYDDTNPEAEEQLYFDKILEAVRWLGYEPYEITYASDHFQRLYDLAVNLIKRGLAYTCDDPPEVVKAERGGEERGARRESKDRNKPIEVSLKEFEDMRLGKYEPGTITLRMKQDMQDPNPQMWDLVAYRVLKAAHHRTGNDWCIYPTYDFTHCLCDSFENISHSLCTVEFVTARQSYEWLCDALELYKPRQSEYGRLNIEGTVTSKRKLHKLVKEHHVSGWDDPRLYTLSALKRRGVPPGAIITFVTSLGVTTSLSTVALHRFETTVRAFLETSTPRLMLVLDPIKVTIANLPADFVEFIEKPLHPKLPAMGTNKVPFTNTVFIERDDFRTEANADFFRLAPGATVGLLNVAHPITYVSHETDAAGNVTSIVCKYENDPLPEGKKPTKPKAFIHWVAEHAASNSPVEVDETRVFQRLFLSDNPAGLDDYLKDLNPKSLTVHKGAKIEVGIWDVIESSLAASAKVVEERKKDAEARGLVAPPNVDGLECVRFQGTRVAYFAIDDPDTFLAKKGLGGAGGGKDKLVLNTIAALKQDSGKAA